MVDRFRLIIFWACGIVLALGAVAYIFALTGSGGDLLGGGSGTLKPTDFATLVHEPDDKGYLLCSPEICPNATSNGDIAIFPASVRDLTLLLANFADNAPNITIRDFNPATSHFELIERSLGSPLPAVLSIQLYPQPNDTTGVAIYSFQPIGDLDNEELEIRAARFLASLSNDLSQSRFGGSAP